MDKFTQEIEANEGVTMRNFLGLIVIASTMFGSPVAAFEFCHNRTVPAGTEYKTGGWADYCCEARSGGSCVMKFCYQPSIFFNGGWEEVSRTLKSSSCFGPVIR
jgi:hypothetical protein